MPQTIALEDILTFGFSVPSPDKQRPVIARALVDCPPMRLPEYAILAWSYVACADISFAFSGASTEMKKGEISMTPYYVVEHLLLRGEVELV